MFRWVNVNLLESYSLLRINVHMSFYLSSFVCFIFSKSQDEPGFQTPVLMSCHCALFSSRLVWFLVRTLISWSLLWNQRLRLFTAESSVSTKWLIWTTKRPWTVTAQLRMLGWEWPRVSHPYYICTTSILLWG